MCLNGEEDYKRTLVNNIMDLNITYNKPPSQEKVERRDELAMTKLLKATFNIKRYTAV